MKPSDKNKSKINGTTKVGNLKKKDGKKSQSEVLVSESSYKKIEGLIKVKTIREIIENFQDDKLNLIAYNIKVDDSYYNITYGELRDRVRAVGNTLLEMGIKKGDKIGILAENRIEWPIIYLAVTSIGAIIVCMDIFLKSKELMSVIKTSEVSIIFSSGKYIDKIYNNIPDLKNLKQIVYFDDLFLKKNKNNNKKNKDTIIAVNEKIINNNFSDRRKGGKGKNFNSRIFIDYNSMLEAGKNLFENGVDKYNEVVVESADVASIVFLSTKVAVMLSHKGLMRDVAGHLYLHGYPGDKSILEKNWLAILPFHHSYPTHLGILLPLMINGMVTIVSSSNMDIFYQTVKEMNTQYVSLVPVLVERLYKDLYDHANKEGLFNDLDLSSSAEKCEWFKEALKLKGRKKILEKVKGKLGLNNLICILSGGGYLFDRTVENFKLLGIDIFNGYGLTETSPVICFNTPEYNRMGSAGLVMPTVDIKIDEPDEFGNGEILAKGEIMMAGYCNLPEKTKESYDDDGWFHTGDIGRFDEDGYLYITGRSKKIIVNQGGKNIYPEEIENALLNSPYISQIVIVPKIDYENGEFIYAIIQPDLEAISELEKESGKRFSDDEIRSLIQKELHSFSVDIAHYKLPRDFELNYEKNNISSFRKDRFMFADELKAGSSDKEESEFLHNDHNIVSDTVSDRQIEDGDDEPSSNPLVKRIESFLVQEIARSMGISESEIDLEMNFLDFLTSMDIVRISEVMDEGVGIELYPPVVFEYTNISLLAGYLFTEFKSQFINYFGEEAIGKEKIDKVKIFEKNKVKESTDDRKTISKRKKNRSFNDREEEPVAIIGAFGKFPGSRDLDEFWKHLEAGDNLITEIPRDRFDWREYYDDSGQETNRIITKWGGFVDDIDKFDPSFFSISPREAELMDPQQRILLETVWKTIEDAGYKPSGLSGTNTGLFVGVANSDYSEVIDKNRSNIDAYTSSGTLYSIIPNRVSYQLNLTGPSEAIDTACSSSLVALHRALQVIRNGDCEIAIVGGVNALLTPKFFIAFSEAGMLSPDGKCKTFGKGANGYVRGEGAGAILLKPLSRAIEERDRIYAVIRGVSVNHGGHANSLTAPNPNAQAELIKSAYEKANVDPETVTYIETHGTGTSLGDPVEINGLKKAFAELFRKNNKKQSKHSYCGLGSVKTNIGHLEAAAGMAGLIKILLSMKHKILPASLHCKEINPYIQLNNSPFYIVNEKKIWQCLNDENNHPIPRLAGLSSFGIGGSNAHVILEEYNNAVTESLDQDDEPQIITLSARNEERLKAYSKEIIEFIEKTSRTSFPARNNGGGLLQEIQGELVKIISEILQVGIEDIALDEEMNEYGFDLVEFTELASRINDKYNLDLYLPIFSEYPSIDSLSRYLLQEQDNIQSQNLPEKDLEETDENNLRLSDIAYTLQVGRDSMRERLAVVVSTVEELREKLINYCKGKSDIDKLYTGNVKSKKNYSRLLMEGPEGREFISIIIKNRKLTKLAQLWASGVEIDWKLLYTENKSQRISLPTYPFERVRYWVSDEITAKSTRNYCSTNLNNGLRSLHPLIDTNESTLDEQVFKKKLKIEEFFINDHIVGDRILLPGVAYLEMAKAAGELALKCPVNIIEDVIWVRPILMDGKAEQDISIGLYPDNECISYKVYSNEGAEKEIYSEGEIVNNPDVISGVLQSGPKRLMLDDIKNRCSVKLEKEEIYEHFRDIGFNYGPRLQMMHKVYCGEMESLVRLNLSHELMGSFSDYGLHPSLMDAALGASLWVGKVNSDLKSQINELSIPFALGQLVIFRPLTEVCYAYAVIPPDKHGKQNKIEMYNITITNEHGDELLRIKDFSVQPAKGRSNAVNANKRKGVDEIIFYQPQWNKIILPDNSIQNDEIFSKGDHISGIDHLVVFDTEKEEYKNLDIKVIHVRPASSYNKLDEQHYQICPGKAEDYMKLFQDLLEHGIFPTYILHVWGFSTNLQEFLGISTGEDINKHVDQYLNMGVYSILYTMQSITNLEEERDTRCLFAFTGINQPQYELISGFANALTTVNHRFKLFSLQLESNYPDKEHLSRILMDELTSNENQNGTEIRYLNNERFVRKIKLLNGQGMETNDSAIEIKPGGIYLITGGAGSLGLIFSEYLAEKYKAKLILTGRSDLSEEKEEKIRGLESLGSEVVYIKADVSRYEDVERLITDIKSRFTGIDGIIHSAGTLGSHVLDADRSDFEKPLLSKIYGTINLDIATQNDDLDFFIMFSSISAIFGDFGTCSYSTANRFLDGYSEYREQLRLVGERKGMTLSINWPLWEEGGMEIPKEDADLYYDFTGMAAMGNEAGMMAFEKAIILCLPQFIVTSGDSRKINRVLGLDYDEVKSESSGIVSSVNINRTETSGIERRENNDAPSSDDEGAMFQQTETYLREIISKIIKMPSQEISSEIEFEEYGITSIMIMEMIKILKKDFGSIPKTLFFEHTNIHDLTGYFVENFTQQLNKLFGMSQQELDTLFPVTRDNTSSDDEGAMFQQTETYLREIISKIIKMPSQEISSEIEFEEYGITSIMIMEMIKILKKDFGSIPKTLFFEHTNIHDLTGYFVENFTQQLNKLFGMSQQERDTSFPRSKENDLSVSMAMNDSNNPEGIIGTPGSSRFIWKTKPEINNRNIKTIAVQQEDIAIIGVSGRFPMANNLEEFWLNLIEGKNCITNIPGDRWDYHPFYDSDKEKAGKTTMKWGGFIDDIDKFDPLFFNITPLEAENMDPQERLFLEISWAVLEDAGYTRKELAENQSDETQRVGVFVGSMFRHYQYLFAGDQDKSSFMSINSYSGIANRISYHFNFRGPSIAIDTACSSSLTAVHMACEAIKQDQCHMAIAGGVNLSLHPYKYLGLDQFGLLGSKGSSMSFGDGDGYVPGEGVGAVFLKPLSDALESSDHIYGVIKASSVNHGGKTTGISLPNPIAHAELMNQSFKKSKINPRTISYVESAANGSAMGDPIEIAGLDKAFKDSTKDNQFCAIGTVKSNIGHLEAASGISQLIKVLLQLKNKKLVPTINNEPLNPDIDLEATPFYLQKELEDWKRPRVTTNGEEKEYPRRATISSFGALGANAHLIVEEHEKLQQQPGILENDPQVMIISARNEERLKSYVQRVAQFLGKVDEVKDGVISMVDIAYTLQVGREEMEERLAIIVKNREDFLQSLENYLENPVKSARQNDVFTGRVKKTRGNIQSFTKGKLGEEIISLILDHRDLKKLAILWVEGNVIPWEKLHSGRSSQRVSLPTYPFEKKRYWNDDRNLDIIKDFPDKQKNKIEPDIKSELNAVGDTIVHIPEEMVSEETVITDLKEMLMNLTKMSEEDIDIEKDLIDYGLESIALRSLLVQVNKRYNIDVGTPGFIDNPSIGEFSQHLFEVYRDSIIQSYKDGISSDNSKDESLPGSNIITEHNIGVDISNIKVHIAVSEEDIEKVYQVRWLGYKKYFNDISEIKDNCDRDPNSILFLATDLKDNPIGTMRILDRRFGKIELDSFIDVDSILRDDESPCVEGTRLSIPLTPDSSMVRYALYKTLFKYCLDNQIPTMILSAVPLIAKDYISLLFEDVGEKGVYYHSLLGAKEHRTYKLRLNDAARLYREKGHPLYHFLFEEKHPNINLNGRKGLSHKVEVVNELRKSEIQ